ncbi:conjugal transfer pilus assembly protein TraW [Novosphingobium indicum]|uniref:Conjugal transfer pilus assembly protein TraW n=2 Tax=Novosphingobium TaxID=165696 RepID=A0ABQ2JUV5_9SPHN|nr:type-F conjugative transfer system protein TraW [Novosphingobium sp. PC22D]GGN55384.1 conjugal transfer pilus assembly protein TraW [Novosphingobium indicum]
MRIRSLAAVALFGAIGGAGLPGLHAAMAVDHGQVGEAWPIIEPDFLDVIKAKLEAAKASGKLDELNARFAERVKAKVMRPTPVAGMVAATESRTWEYDPTITLESDIRDAKGNLIAVAGQRINPLDKITMSEKLLFIDGDDEAQVSWALGQGDERAAKIIMVSGSPFDLMKAKQRRFYFDQAGTLTGKFGIEHTPALVEQKGKLLIVREVALKPGQGS